MVVGVGSSPSSGSNLGLLLDLLLGLGREVVIVRNSGRESRVVVVWSGVV